MQSLTHGCFYFHLVSFCTNARNETVRAAISPFLSRWYCCCVVLFGFGFTYYYYQILPCQISEMLRVHENLELQVTLGDNVSYSLATFPYTQVQ